MSGLPLPGGCSGVGREGAKSSASMSVLGAAVEGVWYPRRALSHCLSRLLEKRAEEEVVGWCLGPGIVVVGSPGHVWVNLPQIAPEVAVFGTKLCGCRDHER